MPYTILTFIALVLLIALQTTASVDIGSRRQLFVRPLPDRPDERRAVETAPTTTARGSFAIHSALGGSV